MQVFMLCVEKRDERDRSLRTYITGVKKNNFIILIYTLRNLFICNHRFALLSRQCFTY